MTTNDILKYVERNGTLPVTTSTMPKAKLVELKYALFARSTTLAHALTTSIPQDSFTQIIQTTINLRNVDTAARKLPYLIARGA